MVKNLILASLFLMLVVIGCSQASQTAPAADSGSQGVDDVGTGLSQVDEEEEQLDSSGLEDVDSSLSEIENS